MPGLEYLVEVSGTFGDTLFVNYMDAAYIFNQNPPTPHLSNPWAINGTNNLRPINDIYNSSHVYEYVVAGNGTQFNFFYEDIYNDYIGSSGQLDFKIYKLVCPSKDTAYACFGDSTASSTVYANGGFPFNPDGVNNSGDEYYEYIWTDASGTVWSTSQTATNLPAGNFKVTITDSLGCTYERDLVVLQSITPLNIDTIIKTDVACKGDSTGEITAVVSGGFSTSIAVLMLGNDTIAFQDNILDTVTFDNLPSNNYDFYVFDTVTFFLWHTKYFNSRMILFT